MSYDPIIDARVKKLEMLCEAFKTSIERIAGDIETQRTAVRALNDELVQLRQQAEDSIVFAAAQDLANETTSEGEGRSETMPSPTTDTSHALPEN